MITVQDIIKVLEQAAPPSLQENYDNAGLLVGSTQNLVEGVLISLDCTEEIVNEAIERNCNLIVAHHPIIFGGLKKLNGKNYVERTVIKAIQNNIAIYAIHTNLDNVFHNGVNQKLSSLIGLNQLQILLPKEQTLRKLVTFIPDKHLNEVKDAIFAAGAGHIGNYSECGYESKGEGSFKASGMANPFVGEKNIRHTEPETRFETIFPEWLQDKVIQALISSHPYEEVAYDIYPLMNRNSQVGSGMIGYFEEALSEETFLKHLKQNLGLQVIKHTKTTSKLIKKVAVCGGAGSFLIKQAKALGADAFVTSDIKYHEFFDAEETLLLCDIGHYESEISTKALLSDLIVKNFPNFAVLLSNINTNPVNYYY